MPNRILEEKQRMSQSLLWKLQENAYTQLGVSAWTEGLVPSYITSNPFIAKKYAALALAYLQDILPKIDPSEPVYIFDLGGGSGQFAYLFLKAFQTRVPFRYVMTDIVESTLEYWQNHPNLSFDHLDFALYRHDQKTPLTLVKSKQVIEKTKNPAILIANYFFDTIPQDLFRVKDGVLEEGLITLTVPEGHEEWERDDPRFIPLLEPSFDYVPSSRELKEYEEATFLYPTGGIESLRFFQRLSGSFLLLAGDQGDTGEGEPKVTKHTTFSIAVNYHSLALYFRQNGGLALLTSFPDPLFANIAAVWGEKASPALERVFADQFDPFTPKDYFVLVSEADKQKELSLDYMWLLLKLGEWDPMNMNHFYPRILAQIKGATPKQQREWKGAIEKVYDNLFVMSKEMGEFVMNLGVLLYEMGDYPKALEYFYAAYLVMGQKPQLLTNIAVCMKKINHN